MLRFQGNLLIVFMPYSQTKRQSKASGTGWFFDMIAKLAEKYNDDAFELAVAESSADENKGEVEESRDSDKKSEGTPAAAEEIQEPSEAAPADEPVAELSALEQLLARASKAAGEGADLTALEVAVADMEAKAAEMAEMSKAKAEAKAEEDRIKAEEEAKIKAEKKAAVSQVTLW
jgi:hypothetical protein